MLQAGCSPLQRAAAEGHLEVVRQLLRHGADVNHQDAVYGDSPLHTSARYGHAGVTRILISARCRASDQNKNGDTALHIAAAMGRRKLTRILLEAGCDKSLKNKQGETSRDIATRKDLTEILAILNVPAAAAATSSAQKRGGSSRRSKSAVRTDASKKREKTESGTSSKDSSTRHKEKKKAKGNSGNKVHFEKVKMAGRQWSPYGCHYYPDPQAFPQPNLDSLPHEPLKRGEQYFLDLAGNICKHMEARLDRDKQELKEHIDAAHARLDEKVSSLERRTHGRLEELTRTVAAERAECTERHAHLTHWLRGELVRGGVHRASERAPQRVERQPSVARARSLEDLLDGERRVPAVLTHNGSTNDILESWQRRREDEFRPVAECRSTWEQDDDGGSSESSDGEAETQEYPALRPKPQPGAVEYQHRVISSTTPDYENLPAYKEQWIRREQEQQEWSPRDEQRWRADENAAQQQRSSWHQERWAYEHHQEAGRVWSPEANGSPRSWSREDHRSETHDARLLVASLGLRSRTAVYSNGTSPATDATADTPNDSGYSTKVYGSSKGPSPELAGQMDSIELPPSQLGYFASRLNGDVPGPSSTAVRNGMHVDSTVVPTQRRNIAKNASLV
ncbi:hypothetical protein B566_EDAN013404 [Ephemera danica]|nr:hypothetical protein B566_EDAN013404 [Ephemera danica]